MTQTEPIQEFAELKATEVCDYRFNFLSGVHPFTFVNWISLKVLMLGGNELKCVPDFCELPLLEELYLNNNKIRTLNGSHFAETPALKVLDLRANKIQSMGPGVFSRLKHLKTLSLASNELKSCFTLPELESLTTLSLACNHLSASTDNDEKNLCTFFQYRFGKIENLNISGNPICSPR
eukprot:Sdes_comp19029_c0_seq4m9593